MLTLMKLLKHSKRRDKLSDAWSFEVDSSTNDYIIVLYLM